MANMSYCMFQNTLQDLRHCSERLDEIGGDISELSDDEKRAAKRLIKICRDIAENYGLDVDMQ